METVQRQGLMISRRDAGVAEAAVLEVLVEAIKNFDDQTAVNIIANTFNNHDQSASVFINPIINPVEKWLQAI